jgi:hypothetical protein
MYELNELEELFKTNEELVKSKAMVHALLRHAATLRQEGLTEEQKQTALDNIKTITHGKQLKPKKTKVEKPTKVAMPKPTGPQYNPAYKQHGIHEEHWNAATPQARQELTDHHKLMMQNTVKKNIDNLYDLFLELKKHI